MARGDEHDGVRVPDGTSPFDFPVWGYGFAPCGNDDALELSVRIPGEHSAVRCPKHAATWHDDGTLTLAPSLLVAPAGGRPGWHGYLERGRFREV